MNREISRKLVAAVCLGLASLTASVCARATPATLYNQPDYQSPVRGAPDDLLLLPGYGFSAADSVVYQAISNTNLPLTHPSSIPGSNTASSGKADIVSVAGAPYTLAVHLPTAMASNQSYALWDVNSAGQWSNGVRINDARPMWITPDYAYATAQVANLPRVLKVVGRNLQPAPGATTQVRLSNSTNTYFLSAIADAYASDPSALPAGGDPVNSAKGSSPQLGRYVAKVALPASMVAGTYTVQLSRDNGLSWVPLFGEGPGTAQSFTVKADPATPASFNVRNYAGTSGLPCAPDDSGPSGNDLVCVLNAIYAAEAAGGGNVVFDAGNWNLELPSDFALTNCLYAPAGIPTSIDPGLVPPKVSCDGIIVPPNVNLVGNPNGSTAATITRGTAWSNYGLTSFTLEGGNTVTKLNFADSQPYTPWDVPGYNNNVQPGAVLKLGITWYAAPGGAGPNTGAYSFPLTTQISNIVVTNDVFTKPFTAIVSGGLPSDHLFITDNIFGGAFNTAIGLGSDPNAIFMPYQRADSVIAYNKFYPGSLYHYDGTGVWTGSGPDAGLTVPYLTGGSATGPIATQLNTALREDFSNNFADGTSSAYFDNPNTTLSAGSAEPLSPNPKGWRAAFFWSPGRSEEMTLVSENLAYCSGDKVGDGESFSYDRAGYDPGGLLDISNNPALALPVISATAGSIVVQGKLIDPVPSGASGNTMPASSYYPGFWLQIVKGPGQGQWRKITAVSSSSNATGATTTFSVSPQFDVAPAQTASNSSLVSISRSYWQNLTIDNYVDQTTPLCTKFNQGYYSPYIGGPIYRHQASGVISWFGTTADSAMEGNQQFDTGGITLYQQFVPPQSSTDKNGSVVKTSNEVRNNLINGEYESAYAESASGIFSGTGGPTSAAFNSPYNPTSPLPIAFSTTIAGNIITGADSSDLGTHTAMGAISLSPGNNDNGPADTSPTGTAQSIKAWKFNDTSLIFANTLSKPPYSTGIGLANLSVENDPETWRAVMYANSCDTNSSPAVTAPLVDHGIGNTRYCPAGATSACECSGTVAADVGVTASGTATVLLNGTVTYTATVTNTSASATAHDVRLLLESSPGLQINSINMTSGTGTCDINVAACALGTTLFTTPGNLAHGQSVTISISGTATSLGSWPLVLSVTHQDPDSNVGNNGVTLSTLAHN